MRDSEALSSEVLERIALLQAAVTPLEQQVVILDFVAEGLKAIPGVDRVDVESLDLDLPATAPPPVREAGRSWTVPIVRAGHHFADLCFTLSDVQSFSPYVPVVEGFTGALGVLLNERRLPAGASTGGSPEDSRDAERSCREPVQEGGDVHCEGELAQVSAAGAELPTAASWEGQPEDDVASHDAAERKRVDEELKASERRAKALLAAIPDMVFRMDRRGVFLDYHAEGPELYEQSSETLIGKCNRDVTPPAFADLVEREIAVVIDSGAMRTFEYELPIPGRGQQEFEARMVKSGEDEVTAIVRNITERKRAEEVLRRTNLLLGRAEEIAHLGSWELDLLEDRLRWSDEVLRIFGLQPQEFLATYEAFLDMVYPDDRSAVEDAFSESLRENRDGYEIEHRIIRRDTGEVRFVHEKCVHERDSTGGIVRCMGTVSDITELKRAEEVRLDLERQIQHAQKLESLGVLAGGIAHDFNNLLAAVLGHAELAMADVVEGGPASVALVEIQKGANRAADLTRQMLAYSGQGVVEVTTLDLSAEVDEMVNLLRASVPRSITLDLQLGRGLPPIEADAPQLQQVVMNLITNSADAIGDEAGTISVMTGEMDCDASYFDQCLAHGETGKEKPLPGTYTYLAVTDTGCGIDEETAGRIFEPFFTTKFTGRGLGMAALLGIVRGHGAALTLDTEVGKGTTFRVLFPVSTRGIQASISDEGHQPELAGEFRGATMLVVDDEEPIRKLVTDMLRRRGVTVLVAADGVEAVEIFSQHADEISCVFLDLTMPQMSGRACLGDLRRIRGDTKVIIMSGFGEESITARFSGEMPDAFLLKPFTMGELLQGAEAVLFGPVS